MRPILHALWSVHSHRLHLWAERDAGPGAVARPKHRSGSLIDAPDHPSSCSGALLRELVSYALGYAPDTLGRLGLVLPSLAEGPAPSTAGLGGARGVEKLAWGCWGVETLVFEPGAALEILHALSEDASLVFKLGPEASVLASGGRLALEIAVQGRAVPVLERDGQGVDGALAAHPGRGAADAP